MEQLVPVGDLQELWIEGVDPDSLERAFLTAMAAEGTAHPGALLLDCQIQGGAGGSVYRVALPCSATAAPLVLPGVPVGAAHASFAIAQGASELNRVMGFLIQSIILAHSGAAVRFVAFHSANGDGAHLVGVVWEAEFVPPTMFGCRITRAWNCKACPAADVNCPANGALQTKIQQQIIPCNVKQLGRSYLVWWNLCLREPVDTLVPGQQPVSLLGTVVERGTGGAWAPQQENKIEGKLQKITGDGGAETPYVFHWVVDGCGSCFVKPGFTGPPFTSSGANPNIIELDVVNTDAAGANATALALEGSLTIVEVDGDPTLLQTVAADKP